MNWRQSAFSPATRLFFGATKRISLKLVVRFANVRTSPFIATVIACGSAVDPLLKHGIVPDFLVIIERDPDLLPFHHYTAEEHDLSELVA